MDPLDLSRLIHKTEQVLLDEWEHYQASIGAENGNLLNRFEHETILVDKTFDEETETYVVTGYIRPEHPLKGKLKEKS